MKKIAVILAFALAMVAVLGAFAETPAAEPVLMEGYVVEITEEGYLIEVDELGEVMVLVGDETVVETTHKISYGDYLYIDYSGMMTRSIPPQITADVLRMYRLDGEVFEANAEENTLLVHSAYLGDVIVNMPEVWAGQEFTEQYVTVYYNGVMTMSIPAQIGAGLVVPGYAVEGEVTEIAEEYIMIGEGASAIQVNLNGAVLPEELAVGDVVCVRYNGMMTRSIPAQINADYVTYAEPDNVEIGE